MAKYAIFFSLKGETVRAMMDKPSDRVAVVRKTVRSLGGRLDAYYWMFGKHDGFVIVDLPDSKSAAAVSLAVSSTGAFGHIETHELIEAGDVNDILAQAKGVSYTPPGA